MNDTYKEFIENYTKLNQLYKQHFGLIFSGDHLWENNKIKSKGLATQSKEGTIMTGTIS
jgi:hypothetical protein